MLMPAKVKHRKQFRGKRRGKATKGNTLVFGDYGLQALDNAWITARQIEAGRVAINRFIKRGGKLWIRLFPDKPVTSKPIEVRMGKGKGDPEFWVDVVKRGAIIYELEGVSESVAKEAMRLAQGKFPIRTRFITRHK
ncbi:MAG: 50S ribosomal protein L16 [Acidobacteriota bacterium]|jgi:large subunit ribosomal protein L16|nr:50S ribosomal protein L16 [Acidobacteriota bacterium]